MTEQYERGERSQEERMRTMEQWQAAHEARCDERYTAILRTVSDIKATMTDYVGSTTKRMDWLLMAIITLALANVVGIEHIRALLRIT